MASPKYYLFVILCAFAAQTFLISAGHEHHLADKNGLSFEATMTHIDAGKNLTRLERIKRAVERGNRRLETLKSRISGTSPSAGALVHPGHYEYLMTLGIGTPPTYFDAIIDTGSDLTWTDCTGDLFLPANSSSYSNLTCSSEFCFAVTGETCHNDTVCSYLQLYADWSVTMGVLATETFAFRTSKKDVLTVRNVAFGCADYVSGTTFSTNANALVGLGRGSLSMISQLDEPQFSYCLTPVLENEPTKLFLGSSASSLPHGPVRTTPLVQNPKYASFYYMTVLGIIIGKKRLHIPPETFAIKADGTGGVVVDSGTTLFYIPTTAYNPLAKELTEQIKLKQANLTQEVGLDHCWIMPSSGSYSFPKFILHLKGAYIELFRENYLIEVKPGVQCLAMSQSDSLGFSIFGNIAQQGYMVRYDLAREELTFVPSHCKGL